MKLENVLKLEEYCEKYDDSLCFTKDHDSLEGLTCQHCTYGNELIEKLLEKAEMFKDARDLYFKGNLINDDKIRTYGKSNRQLKQHVIPELLEVCKNCVDWFEKVKRYQNQRLGHGFKEACQNWSEASDVEVFDFTKMKQAIKRAEGEL